MVMELLERYKCLSNTTVKSNKDAEASVSNNKEKEQNDDKWDNMTTDPQLQLGIIRLHYNEWMCQSIDWN